MTDCRDLTIELLATISGHTDRVWSLAWHPFLPLLTSCSADQTLRLAHFSRSLQFPASSRLISSDNASAHTRTIRHLSWHPNGIVLATASFDSTVGIWEPAQPEEGIEDDEEASSLSRLSVNTDWECVSTLEGHESEIKSIAWSKGGNLLATCGRDKSVWVWECMPGSAIGDSVGDFECLAVMMDHEQDVKCVAWHPTLEVCSTLSCIHCS